MRPRIPTALWGVAFAVTAADASAHVTGVSRGDYTPHGTLVHAEIVMRADEASLAGTTPEALVESITVAADGAACSAHLDSAEPEAPDGIRLRAAFTCPHVPERLHLHFGLLDRLPAGHRHLATVHLPAGDVETLAILANPDLEVSLPPGAPPAHRRRLALALAALVAVIIAMAAVVIRRRQIRGGV